MLMLIIWHTNFWGLYKNIYEKNRVTDPVAASRENIDQNDIPWRITFLVLKELFILYLKYLSA